MTSTLLTEVQEKVNARLAELEPAHLEYLELAAYREAMGGFQSPVTALVQAQLDAEPSIVTPPAVAAAAAAPAAAAKPKPAAAKKPAPRTRPGSAKKPAAKAKPAAANELQGETVAKVVEIVAAHNDSGGITVGDVIKEGALSTSYTYDVVKRLTEGKELVKRNRKLYLGTARTRTPVVSAPQTEAAAA